MLLQRHKKLLTVSSKNGGSSVNTGKGDSGDPAKDLTDVSENLMQQARRLLAIADRLKRQEEGGGDDATNEPDDNPSDR